MKNKTFIKRVKIRTKRELKKKDKQFIGGLLFLAYVCIIYQYVYYKTDLKPVYSKKVKKAKKTKKLNVKNRENSNELVIIFPNTINYFLVFFYNVFCFRPINILF